MKKIKFLLFIVSFLVLSSAVSAQAFEKLCPTKNESYCVQAKKMIEAAWSISVGEELGNGGWEGIAAYMLKFGTVDETKFKNGIKIPDAQKFIKLYIGKLSPGDGAKAISNAFNEVYGTTPTKEEMNNWMDQIAAEKAWYSTIVLAENKKLNDDSARKTKMINLVYSRVMGRSAKPEELSKLLPENNHYRPMFNQTKAYLYSDKGKADLRETVRKALSAAHYQKTKDTSYVVPDADIDKYVKIFTPLKLTHPEMLKYLTS